MPVAARLVLRTVVLAAIVVGAIVATAKADVWWVLTIAVAALVVAAGALGFSVGGILRAEDDAAARVSGRAPFAVAVVALAAVVLAIALPIEDSAGASTARPTAAAAAQTVRDFLASAVLDDNAYAACEYLTPAAQEAIAGPGQTCRDALTGAEPAFAGIHSVGALHALALHAVLRGPTAYVTSGHVTFVLQRTTGDEAAAYQAPPSVWRIARGATAVLGYSTGRS